MNQNQEKSLQISIGVEANDALTFDADVLALKYAQSLHGVDKDVVEQLLIGDLDVTALLPEISEISLIDTKAHLAPKAILFVGVKTLREFGYSEIREFGRKVLSSLANSAPETKHLCLTTHGSGYGLDETEAFEEEVSGILDAISTGNFPKQLERITIVERNAAKVKRLSAVLRRLLPRGVIEIDRKGDLIELGEKATDRLRETGNISENKPYIFVAMPFAEEMDDIFHYGIQGAVHATGFLCERADLSAFTGDVMEWVKKRIECSALVIADLSTANPNVYLEVGYAWGCRKPTVLLIRDSAELKFDVKGQRCLVYKKIKDLEISLQKELEQLKHRLIQQK